MRNMFTLKPLPTRPLKFSQGTPESRARAEKRANCTPHIERRTTLTATGLTRDCFAPAGQFTLIKRR